MEQVNASYSGKKIGIFGGTFDPPHIGHLILAEEARVQLDLAQVLWVITPKPPHKINRDITHIGTRLRLVSAAIKSNPFFEISTVEIDRSPPYFAVDTVRILGNQHPRASLVYLVGGDSLHDLPKWHTPDQFIDACNSIGVMRRPNDEIVLEEICMVLPKLSGKLLWIEAPLLEVSASEIRRKIAYKEAYQYYVHPEVYRIIMDENLYMD